MDIKIKKALNKVASKFLEMNNESFIEMLEEREKGPIFYALNPDEPIIHNRVVCETWISVKDRLPTESGAYLVVYGDIDSHPMSVNQYTAHLIETGFSDNTDDSITHWMKLPLLPKDTNVK